MTFFGGWWSRATASLMRPTFMRCAPRTLRLAGMEGARIATASSGHSASERSSARFCAAYQLFASGRARTSWSPARCDRRRPGAWSAVGRTRSPRSRVGPCGHRGRPGLPRHVRGRRTACTERGRPSPRRHRPCSAGAAAHRSPRRTDHAGPEAPQATPPYSANRPERARCNGGRVGRGATTARARSGFR